MGGGASSSLVRSMGDEKGPPMSFTAEGGKKVVAMNDSPALFLPAAKPSGPRTVGVVGVGATSLIQLFSLFLNFCLLTQISSRVFHLYSIVMHKMGDPTPKKNYGGRFGAMYPPQVFEQSLFLFRGEDKKMPPSFSLAKQQHAKMKARRGAIVFSVL